MNSWIERHPGVAATFVLVLYVVACSIQGAAG
jgi:hypothetical protein